MTTASPEQVAREARRIEEDTLYSAKGHFSAAHVWGNLHLWLGVPAALIAGVAGVSALAEFDNHGTVAAVLALTVAALTAVATFLKPEERVAQHREYGNRYNALRNRSRIFADIEVTTLDERLVDRLLDLSGERDELNQTAPQIPRWAFRRAKRGIETGQATYRVDSESG